MPYPWYETLENSSEIQQGDFIPQCPIIIPPTNLIVDPKEGEIQLSEELTVQTLNAIVVSQSCDLQHNKVDIVLVCPYYTLAEFFSGRPENERSGSGRRNALKTLRQGHYPAYHLLNKGPDNGIPDFCVTDFKNVYGVNFEFLRTFVGQLPSRVRLLPPYREHLSQAFARFFMRVGLPNDIEGLQ